MKIIYIPQFITITVFFYSMLGLQAQNVGIGTNSPDPSAKLHINDNSRGLLIPRLSLSNVNVAAPVTAPAIGLLVFNNNNGILGGGGSGFYYWDGSQWQMLKNGANTLDMAYDEGGPGAGRIINADAGVVEINGSGGLWVNASNPAQNSGIQVNNSSGTLSSEVEISYINSSSGNNNLQGIRSINDYAAPATGVFDGSYGVFGTTRHPTGGNINLNTTANSNNKAIGVAGSLGSSTDFSGSAGDMIAAVAGITGNHNSGGGAVTGARLYAGLFSGNGRTLGLWGENSTYIELIPRRQVNDYKTAVIGFYNSAANAGNNGANIGTGDSYLSIESNVTDATQKDVVLQARSNGSVGIGTSTPSEKLHVSGGIRVSSLAGTNNRLVQADATGVLSSIADGINGQVLTTNGAGSLTWQNTASGTEWNLSGNAGTNPTNNFLGTTDNQDLVIRTNNVEKMRINTDGNVGIGTQSNLARLYTNLPNTNTTTRYGFYNYMDGASTSSTYAIYNRNLSSTNSVKYGIYNFVNNEGTGSHYGIMNYTYMNTASNSTGFGNYNYLSSYGTGNHRASYNNLNHSGTAVSTQNYAAYNLINIATSSNTSTIYGEYTEVDFSAGPSYGEYKELNSNASYTSEMYGDYNQMLGTGNGTSYAVYNDFDNTGTGAKYGVRNEFADVGGAKYGLYNNFANGTATGTIYGVYNNILNDANATKYGTYNRINGGDGSLRGSFNSITPATTNTSTIYGVYGSVSSNGTGLHYGGYFSAYGDNNRAVYAANTHPNGWAAYFSGRGYFSGNVGIGTTAPTEKLHVVSDRILLRNGSDAIYCSYNNITNYGFELIGSYPGFGASVQRAIILGGYNQNNTNGQGYDAANRIQCGGGNSATLPIYATSHITTSSEKFKQNISALQYGLEEVLKINPVSYQYTFDKTKLYKVGFIAEQVSKIIPEVVAHHDEEGNEVSYDKGQAVGMEYAQMTAVLVNAVKEQQAQIEELKRSLLESKERIQQLENK